MSNWTPDADDEPAPIAMTLAQMSGRDDAVRSIGEWSDPWSPAARWASTIPLRFREAFIRDFAGQPETTLDPLKDWARAPQGRNLVILGPVGVGKSHAAVACLQPSNRQGVGVRFYPVDELLDLLRPGGPDEAFALLVEEGILLIDDLGAERHTDWTVDRVYALLNRRWLEKRPTVATSNLSPGELEEALGPRAYSRLVGSDAVVVRLAGPDRRRTRPKEDA